MSRAENLTTAYGIRTKSTKSGYMNKLYHMMETWGTLMEVGATPPVDIYPWLKHIPEKLFGSYITRARSVEAQMSALYTDMLNRVVRRRAKGPEAQLDTLMAKALDQQAKEQLTPNQLRFLGGVLLEGGSDTTSSIILSTVKALIHHPEIPHKAQAEIDAVVGHGRSPVWSDFPKLPYINMIVKEAQRWRPLTPLGFPHALSEGEPLPHPQL